MAWDGFDIETVRSLNRIACAIEEHSAVEKRKAHALERIADIVSRSQPAFEKNGGADVRS